MILVAQCLFPLKVLLRRLSTTFIVGFFFSIFLKMEGLMTFSPIFIMFDSRSGYMKF